MMMRLWMASLTMTFLRNSFKMAKELAMKILASNSRKMAITWNSKTVPLKMHLGKNDLLISKNLKPKEEQNEAMMSAPQRQVTPSTDCLRYPLLEEKNE